MKKLAAILLMILVAVFGVAMAEGAQAGEAAGIRIEANIADGGYVIRVIDAANMPGEWRADDMAQDPSVVTLTGAKMNGADFEARYDAAGDGEATVSLRHFTGIACDRVMTFDLKAEGGAIVETTGGSEAASPNAADLAGALSGSWLEQETQFTALTIGAPDEQGFRATVTSPMTHGAYVFTMTLSYDCELDALVYADGAVYDLMPDSDPDNLAGMTPRAEGINGSFALVPAGDGETVLLQWTPGLEGLEETVFCKAEGEAFPLAGQSFEFTSGVGGWYTVITFAQDGSFAGEYHDSEMGEAEEAYPEGTVYGCLFHGQMSQPEQVDSLTLRMTVTGLTPDEGQIPEFIEDGIRYVTTEPYGIADGDALTLYLPGTPVKGFSEEFLFWSHVTETDPHAEVLPWAVLWNAAAETGFVCLEETAE